MYGLKVNEYFIQVETGMKKDDVIGGPIYGNEVANEVVGRIIDYIPKTGFMKIELLHAIDYKNLIRFGIPLSSIIFKNTA